MKKNFSLRVIAVLLAILMLAPALIACNEDPQNEETPAATTTVGGNKDPQNPDGTTTGSVGVITPEVPKNEFGIPIIDPGLPVEDYDGRDFVVHTRGNVQQYEWFAEKITGEELNDAIFERNEVIMDKYNINIVVQAEGTWADYANKTLVAMKTNIKANTGAYDLIAGYSAPISSMVTTGLLYDLNELDYIDFDQPWWSSDFAEKMTIADKTFFGVGSLSLSMIYSMFCIAFNKTLLDQIKNEDGTSIDLYELTLAGDWTWDKLVEYANKIYLDDGDGVPEKTDRYGFALATSSNDWVGLLSAAGVNMVATDENGDLYLAVDVTYTDKVLTKIIDMAYNTQSIYNPSMNGAMDTNQAFTDGTLLFQFCWLYSIQTQYSKVMNDYGILPMPKFNEDQDDYLTGVQEGLHMYCIPIDAKDAEANSIITEALACESYHELVPKYLQICLKSRYSPEENDAKCIDILYNTVTFDLARTFNSTIGIQTNINNMINLKAAAFGRVYTAQKSVFEKKLADLVNGVENPVA